MACRGADDAAARVAAVPDGVRVIWDLCHFDPPPAGEAHAIRCARAIGRRPGARRRGERAVALAAALPPPQARGDRRRQADDLRRRPDGRRRASTPAIRSTGSTRRCSPPPTRSSRRGGSASSGSTIIRTTPPCRSLMCCALCGVATACRSRSWRRAGMSATGRRAPPLPLHPQRFTGDMWLASRQGRTGGVGRAGGGDLPVSVSRPAGVGQARHQPALALRRQSRTGRRSGPPP